MYRALPPRRRLREAPFPCSSWPPRRRVIERGILLAGPATVIVELFGIARHQAGCSELTVEGRTVLDVLNAVRSTQPKLLGLVTENGAVARQYLVSLDGDRFIDDTGEVVPRGSRLLILGADPGG